MVNILQRSNYLIFFDDVRVDPYLINWQTNGGLFADSVQGSVTLYRAPAMDKWKAYLTQVRIFGENPFTQKFQMIFEGEIANRSWNEKQSNSGTVTYAIKGFYHWLDIPIPMGITYEDQFTNVQRFIYEAQNIDIDAVRELMISKADLLGLDKTIEELIKMLFQQLTIGYYDVAGEETTFAFAKMEERFKVMVDVAEEFRQAGFLDLFTFTKASNIQSFYVFLNEVLSQLMFEFYQDRDGSLRIKTPSWGDPVLKAHTLDASIIGEIKGADYWDQEPTRILAIGAESQLLSGQANTTTGVINENLTVPVGLYVGNPRDPDSEMYYSQLVNINMDNFGTTGGGDGEAVKYFGSGDWFDNLSDQKISSEHFSKNPSRSTHYGVDFPYPVGTPIYSIGTYGTVREIGAELRSDLAYGDRGNYIIITQEIDGQKYEFQYMHFKSAPVVKVGDKIAPGQLIGYSGNTGASTGPHLHFEIWKGKTYSGKSNSLHPVDFLKKISVEKESTSSSGNNWADISGAKQGSALTSTPQNVSAAPSAATLKAVGVTDFSANNVENWDVYHISAYTATCAGCSGITAGGKNVKDQSLDHRVIAVDRSVIPLGSIVEIEGLGYFTAYDVGGAIKGKRIDLLVRSNKDASAWGRRNMRVRVIRRGKGNGSMVNSVNAGADFNTLVSGSSAAKYTELPNNISLPKGGSYQNADSKSVISTSNTPSNAYAGVDLGLYTGFKPSSSLLNAHNKKKEPVGVSYPMPSFKHTVPSYAPVRIDDALRNNNGKIDGNLLASIIAKTSSWKDNYNAGGMVGIAGIPQAYADEIAYDKDLFDPSVNVNVASDFLSSAMSQFNGKVTFALAAYKMGGFKDLKDMVEEIGAMDFVALRESGKLSDDVIRFVDSVLKDYLSLTKSDFIKGDPHKKMDTKDAQATDTELSEDFNEGYKPKLSDEERKYKVNLKRVEQALIRLDSAAAGSMEIADKLIYQYAKYMMQLYRAKSHDMTVTLTTCLPFLRLGYNVWIEPTRTDVVGYITNISHYGSFQQGCFTTVNAGFIRRPEDYQEIDTSIFIGQIRATSEVFGEVLSQGDMETLRSQLKELHGTELNEKAHKIPLLREIYGSMNGDTEYATEWNKEYTRAEIEEKIQKIYNNAPEIVKERKQETAEIFEKSKSFFMAKLMFTRTY